MSIATVTSDGEEDDSLIKNDSCLRTIYEYERTFMSTVIIASCKTAASCQKTVYTKLLTPSASDASLRQLQFVHKHEGASR
jgi:hypothetical protein